jgi:hypothetical protein
VERPTSVVAPYKLGPDGQWRPYLLLTLIGVKPAAEREILGLVDTGADRSVLPIDYAAELGYTVDELAAVEVGQVDGSASAWLAQRPCKASVDGIPEVEFEIAPFVRRQPQHPLGARRPDDELYDQRFGEGQAADPPAELVCTAQG